MLDVGYKIRVECPRDWGLRFMRLYSQYTSWDNSREPERPLTDAKTMKFKDRVLKRCGMWRDIYGLEEKKVASIV
nr:hypothetical protein [Tanacetum cinerariifolium]